MCASFSPQGRVLPAKESYRPAPAVVEAAAPGMCRLFCLASQRRVEKQCGACQNPQVCSMDWLPVGFHPAGACPPQPPRQEQDGSSGRFCPSMWLSLLSSTYLQRGAKWPSSYQESLPPFIKIVMHCNIAILKIRNFVNKGCSN